MNIQLIKCYFSTKQLSAILGNDIIAFYFSNLLLPNEILQNYCFYNFVAGGFIRPLEHTPTF